MGNCFKPHKMAEECPDRQQEVPLPVMGLIVISLEEGDPEPGGSGSLEQSRVMGHAH